MNIDQKALLKTSIQRKIKRLTTEIEELKEVTKPVVPENSIGRLSRMEAINSKSVAEASLRNCENRLKKLKRSLQNISNADFGLCIKCKQPIQVPRLKLMPESEHCVKCAR